MKAVLKGWFAQREAEDGEKRAEQHITPIWAVLLRTACVQWSHHLLTDHASWESWTTAVGPLLVIEFTSHQRGSMHFLQ